MNLLAKVDLTVSMSVHANRSFFPLVVRVRERKDM